MSLKETLSAFRHARAADKIPDDDPDAMDGNEDDEDEEETPEARAAGARGRKAERRRIATILANEAVAGREQLALHLAVKTDMSVRAAVATLRASPRDVPKTATGPLGAAMAATANAVVGPGAADPRPKSLAERVRETHGTGTGDARRP